MLYKKYLKRPLDLTLSLIAIVILSPVLLMVACLVRIKLGTPIIFKQKRPGLNEKIFTMYKFRSMTDKKDNNGELLSDSERLTSFGKWLRSTSLDELPELFNIIKGDMSIVGPRPQLVKDMVFMTPEQRKRHTVRPGLTGLAQVSGRNSITWENKLRIDLEYIKDIHLLNDIRIVISTFFKVFKKEDISQAGYETGLDLGDHLMKINNINQEEYELLFKQSNELISIHGKKKYVTK